MLTAAERHALILTVTFLLLGAGIKAWIRARVELGPFPTAKPLGPDIPSPTALPSGHDSPGPTALTSGSGSPVGGTGAAAPSDSSPAGPAHGDSARSGSVDTLEAGPPVALAEEMAGRPRDIPGRGTVAPDGPRSPKAARKQAPRGKVDLNRASVEHLAGVPGIGPRTAEAIVAYRRDKGGIRDVRELLEVKGIGEKKLERIAPWVMVPEKAKPVSPAQAEPPAGADGAGEVGLVSP